MELFEAIQKRRTVQTYQNTPEIKPALLRKMLEASLLAPNHKFTFPWKFIIVGPETRLKLKSVAKKVALKKKGKTLSPEEDEKLNQKTHKRIMHPAALVIFCCAQCDNEFQQREDYATLACSIQNYSLALSAEGYGSKWSTGGLAKSSELYEFLNIDRDEYEIVGLLWAGHSDVELPPSKRPTLDQVLEVMP